MSLFGRDKLIKILFIFFPMAVYPVNGLESHKLNTQLTIQSDGKPYGLSFEKDSAIVFCDNVGAKQLNLYSGRLTRSNHACESKIESNANCSNSDINIDVHTPSIPSKSNASDDYGMQLSSFDVVDIGNYSYPLDDHVEYYSCDGKSISITTATSVIRIHTQNHISYTLDSRGGNQIVTHAGWTVWLTDSQVRAAFEWKRYELPKFKIQGFIPTELFSESASSAMGDSLKIFEGVGVQLNIFGSQRKSKTVRNEYEAAIKAHETDNDKISYKTSKDNWFVISGTMGTSIFYTKTLFLESHIATIELKYDKSKKNIFNSLVKSLVGSFGESP